MLWAARRNSFSFGCEKRIFRAIFKEKVGTGEGEIERELYSGAPWISENFARKSSSDIRTSSSDNS
jgi:hypothetical protein